jgi:hypothetical protein
MRLKVLVLFACLLAFLLLALGAGSLAVKSSRAPEVRGLLLISDGTDPMPLCRPTQSHPCPQPGNVR